LIYQHAFKEAEQLLAPIQPERITTDQAYRLFLLRGQIHLGVNEFQEAVVDLRSAVSQGEGMNDIEYIERARNLLGKAYFSLYNYTLAMENHQRSNTAIENGFISDPIFALDVYSNLANDYFRLGDLEKAITFYHRALAALEEMNRDSRGFAQKYMEISLSYKAADKPTMARDYATRSLALYEMRDEQRIVGLTHQRLGKALERQNDLDGAEGEYKRAITIERELDDEISVSVCLTSLAELLLKRGSVKEARREAQEALKFARSSKDAQTQGQALMTLAQIEHQSGDFEAADKLFAQALEQLDASDAHEIAASAYFRFANLLEQRGDVQGSLNAIKKAYEHQRQGNRGAME